MQLSLIAALSVLAAFAPHWKGSSAQTTVRPYKFGFTIDEQQHRAEKRDERGIVMGEFGFITADGIYHVTVYATDEEGKFRILAMRNYPYESPPKTIDMVLVPQRNPVTAASPTPTKTPLPRHNFINEACSGCFLNKRKPEVEAAVNKALRPKSEIRPLSRSLPPASTTLTAATPPVSFPGGSSTKSSVGQPFPAGKSSPAGATAGTQTLTGQQSATGHGKSTGNVQGGGVTSSGKSTEHGNGSGAGGSGKANGFAVDALPGGNAVKPNGFVDSKQASGDGVGVGRATISGVTGSGKGGVRGDGQGGFRGAKAAGEETGDLYRFKYTLDYNGHAERGSLNGNKEGNYFAIGDDSVERTIEYVANENGFQPRIRFRKLDKTQSRENALKDYEFVWFNKS